MKPKIIITSLTSCSGCIVTLFTLDIFLQFLDRINLVYFPFIKDELTVEEGDIALVEGCVIKEEQIEYLKKIRKISKRVFALGTCAAFGGILNLSENFHAEPISKFIEIDGFIPGCPPPSKLLGNCIIDILENRKITLPEKNLCFNCPLREEGLLFNHQIDHLTPPIQKSNNEENEHCFLKNGILCLGPVTREGCECQCIKNYMPCEGCMGPIKIDFTSNIINFLSMLDLSDDLEKYTGIYYRFSKPKIIND